MNKDLTIVYYTCNRIPELVSERVRKDLLNKSEGIRIISVSHKPIDFGENICVGEVGWSVYNLYTQVLIGAREVKTPFMICAEDDFIYPESRFKFKPVRDDTFYYDSNRWTLTREGIYFWRGRTSFGTCIAPAKFMIETLEERFQKYRGADHPRIRLFGEPGRLENHLGVTPVKMERIFLKDPIITFNHRDSLGNARKRKPTDEVKYDLYLWGNGKSLWDKFWNPKPEAPIGNKTWPEGASLVSER